MANENAPPPPDGADDSSAGSHQDAQPPPDGNSKSVKSRRWRHGWRRWFILGGIAGVLAVAGIFLVPYLITAINTISTDDAYVNGHVTFVAPRVAGQIKRVLVDDNMHVKKGALLAELDKEPYLVQLKIKQAAVVAAKSDLTAARAQARGYEAQARSQKWQVQVAMNQVHNRVASLRADVATYESKKASMALAEANLRRGVALLPQGGISAEDVDQRRTTLKVAEAEVQQALHIVYADRVYLGLPAQPRPGDELNEAPPNLEQDFASVRSALASFGQTAAQLGLSLPSSTATPADVFGSIPQESSQNGLDQHLESLVNEAPAVKQAEAKLLQAERDLEQAQLNLRYCDIVAEVDGIVTRRNVNPGNNIAVGQSLMSIRSVREIWIDCNFKETQLRDLRIGQRVVLDVDMYGGNREFEGRITGFTMGTGSTLSLLPPQNATGNFVKVVQRLPVRVNVMNYDPERDPLYVGLSVTPYVYFKEPPQGPHAGDRLQPVQPLPILPVFPAVGLPETSKPHDAVPP